MSVIKCGCLDRWVVIHLMIEYKIKTRDKLEVAHKRWMRENGLTWFDYTTTFGAYPYGTYPSI